MNIRLWLKLRPVIGRAIQLSAALLIASIAVPTAFAQDYPNRLIRLVVAYGPGSGADTIGRIIAQGLGERVKTSVVVENRDGAGGAMGTASVAKAAPDGYTLLLGTTPMVISPHMQQPPTFDGIKDFIPISRIGEIPLLLVTHPNAPFKSLPELVSYAKQHPGELSYATSGKGSLGHLAFELIRNASGINVVDIPYKNVGGATTDLIAGNVSFYFSTQSAALPHVKSGRLVPLAISASERSPLSPGVPTVAEATGRRGLEAVAWYGLFAPSGTPPAIVGKLQEVMNQVMSSPETRDKLSATGVLVKVDTTANFASELKADNEKYRKVVKELDLKY